MYCLACFADNRPDAERCRQCRADLVAQGQLDYAEKLKMALFHPSHSVRMGAIIALGLRAEADAVEALMACAVDEPLDVVEGIEVARALKRIEQKHPELDVLSELARRHPSEIVRHAIGLLQSPLPVCPYRDPVSGSAFSCAAGEGEAVNADTCLACALPDAIAHPRACLFLLPLRHHGEARFACRCYSTRGSVLSAKNWRTLCFCGFWFPRPKIECELAIPGLHPARQHALAVLRGEIAGEAPPPPGFSLEPCTKGTLWQRWHCRIKRTWHAWRVVP